MIFDGNAVPPGFHISPTSEAQTLFLAATVICAIGIVFLCFASILIVGELKKFNSSQSDRTGGNKIGVPSRQ